MRRLDGRISLSVAAVAVFVATGLLQTRILEPERQRMIGRRSELPRALQHAAEYNSARAAGERPRFIPGEQGVDLADVPNRAATLSLGGLRGFLAIYLWIDAETSKHERIHEDLLDRYHRIANLQSDYTSVWNFHAWNLAWNLSVQWSNAERRYQWIRYGIDFLHEGIRRNPGSVDLLETMGRIYRQRIAENNRPDDREYFSERVEEDDGQRPLRIAYKWYKEARLIQDETGDVHSLFSKKVLHEQSCYVAHEYAKELTRDALAALLEASQLQAADKAQDAAGKFEKGRAGLLVARRWWTTAAEDWARQRAQFPDDYNARIFGEGAEVSGTEIDDLLAHLTPELLRADARSFGIRVKSAQGMARLVERNHYDEDPPEAYHAP